MGRTLVLGLLCLVTFVTGQSQVPPLRLKIARNNLSPNDSVVISWEMPPASVRSFSVEWEEVVSGQGGEINVPVIPNKEDRYSAILSPLAIGQEYNVEVTAILAPPLRLSEFKSFTFAPNALADVQIFGVTQRSMGINVTALEPLTDRDVLSVTVRSDGVVVPTSNITFVSHMGRSRLLNVYFPQDIIVVPSKTYEVRVESMFLGALSSSVSEWITLNSVPAATVFANVTGITQYAMELDVSLAKDIDYSFNFSLVVDVFDMNGKLHGIRNGLIRNTRGPNNTIRIFFTEPLTSGSNYVVRIKTIYNGVESYWFSDLRVVNLHPEVTSIREVVRDSTTSFNITLGFGAQLAPAYRLSWRSQDGQYVGNDTFPVSRNLSHAEITVSNLTPGQTYIVSIEALGNDGVRTGLDQTITLAPSSPFFLGVDRNGLDPSRSVILKWKSGQGKTDSFMVVMEGGEKIEVIAQPDRQTESTEYTAAISTPVMGSNYFGNITAFSDGLASNPALFGFTFAPSAPTSVMLAALTPLQAELNVSQFEAVPPTPLVFLLQDELGTFYPPQNGTFLSTDGRHRQVRMFFNPPLVADRRYIIGVQSNENGTLSLPVLTTEAFRLDPFTPTLIDAQPVGDDKAFLLWLPGESIPQNYLIEWFSLDSTETGRLEYLTPATYVEGPLNVTITNLTSSHRYKFNVRALGSPLTSSSLNSTVAIPPARPRHVRIFPTPSSPSDSLTMSWQSGRGTIDYYNVTLAGSDGLFLQRSIPATDSPSGEFRVEARPAAPGATYLGSVYSVAGNTVSDPVSVQFVNVPYAPTSVSVTGIAQYSIDLAMIVVNDTASVDSINVLVSDEDGVAYPPQNISITPGGGKQRMIRLVYDQSMPLALDRQYTVTVQTVSNRTVSGPVNTRNPVQIDPRTPSLIGIVSDGRVDPQTGKTTTMLALAPGAGDVTSYRVEWFATDSSERGNVTHAPPPQSRQQLVVIPLTSLTPGQMYMIRVTGIGPTASSRTLASYLPLRPLPPKDLSVRRDTGGPNPGLVLQWSSSGGRVDYFAVEMVGSDGVQFQEVYRPAAADPASGPFTVPLGATSEGLTYNVAITSAVDRGLASEPSVLTFTQAAAAPTEVRLTKISQNRGELEVTLLDETAENPEVEVEVVDNEGQVYRASNDVVWEGTGQTRRLKFSLQDNPLPANQTYTVHVRSLINGNWTAPAVAEQQTFLDPLMPSVWGIQGVQDGENVTGTLILQLDPAVEEYRVEWFSTDNTEAGHLTGSPVLGGIGPAIDVPITGLTPGQSYIFTVQVTAQNQTIVGPDYPVTFAPSKPLALYVDRNLTYSEDAFFLQWQSGGGKVDRYGISIVGNDGLNIDREYIPEVSDPGLYSVSLPQLTVGGTYLFAVQAFSNDIQSQPAFKSFRYVETDPTAVTLLGITPYEIDIGVTLLGNTTETPELEASVRSGQGQDIGLFLSSGNATWTGTGRDRVVRLSTFDTPLQANQDYKVSIRTWNDGNWSVPVMTENTVILSPLTPTVTSIQTTLGADGLNTGSSDSAVVRVLPGESPVESYLVEWVDSRGVRNSTTYMPTNQELSRTVSIPVTGLTPGDQYTFTVTAIQGNEIATGLKYSYTQVPATPVYLTVEPHPNPDNSSLVLSWKSGGGMVDYYGIRVEGTDGMRLEQDYIPSPDHDAAQPYSITLQYTIPGESYAAFVESIVDQNVRSPPAYLTFTSLPTAPTEVKLTQVTRYGGELNVTLLGNATVTPDLEVTLRDSQGQTYTSNKTVWEGTGRQRLVRVNFKDTPLPANTSYSVSVRTAYNGSWTVPVTSQEQTILDPLAPSVLERERSRSTAGTYTLVWMPGDQPAEEYLIEWRTEDGSEAGNRTYVPTIVNPDGSLSATFDNLTPGQSYVFQVTAVMGDQTSPGIATMVPQPPATPVYLTVEPHPDPDNSSLVLSWKSGGGMVDYYGIRVESTDGMRLEQDYIPSPDHDAAQPYSITLPYTIPGESYAAFVEAVVDQNVRSPPAYLTFTSLPTAPTEVKLTQVTRYGGELNVTLLGNATVTPDLEVTLRDSQGQTYTSNKTVWEGTGRQRLVRVNFKDTPLPANTSYSVSVRTAYNGSWTVPVTSQEQTILDPLAPSVLERQSSRSTAGTYTLVWMPGDQFAEEYLIEWRTEDGSEAGNRTYVPTSVNPDGSLSATFDNLTPGQSYVFQVTAVMGDQTSPGIATMVALDPAMPESLAVEPAIGTNDILFTWYPGRSGRVNGYEVKLAEAGVEIFTTFVTPENPYVEETTKLSVPLPALTEGMEYDVSVTAVSDGARSPESSISFVYDRAAPSRASVGKVYQDAFEMNVTLLGENTDAPQVEVALTDEEGNVYPSINGTIVQKSGTLQVVRFPYNETSLPENRTYIATIRTYSNGVWSSPIVTRIPLIVDPLAPSLLGVVTRSYANGTRTAVLTWESGSTVPDTLTISWWSANADGSGNVVKFVTDKEQRGETTIRNLIPGETYTFFATAQKANLSSTSSNFTLSMRPSPIKSVSIEPSRTSPEDTVVMSWEEGDGVIDFHRISMEGPEGVVFHADVPVTEGSGTSLHNVSLSPVILGSQYQVTIWSVVNKNVLSSPTEVHFMFAPTAPTFVNLRELGGNSAEVEVDMFDAVRSDVTKSLNVSLQDEEGNSYFPDRVLEWKRDGRRSHLRLWFDERLPTNQTYTATAISQINGTWTEPISSTTRVALDLLKPYIIEVSRGAVDQSVVLLWRSGALPADSFTVEMRSRLSGDVQTKSEGQIVPEEIMKTAFDNLKPGREYLFTVTAFRSNQLSESLPYPYTLDPVSPSNLRVDYSDVSPSNSVMLIWDFDDGEADFFRIIWTPIGSAVNSTIDVLPNATLVDGQTTYEYRLSPLHPGDTYRLLLQAVSSARPGKFVEKVFTFAPTSASSVTVVGATPYDIKLNVSLFDNSWENVKLRTLVTDDDNNTYIIDNNVVWEIEGRQGSARLKVNETRLPAGRNFSMTVQTQYNGEWSYPVASSFYLDVLTPAVLKVEKSTLAPESAFTVSWVPGSLNTQFFVLTVNSTDGMENWHYDIPAEITELDMPLNFTVAQLTPGQKYIVELSAVQGEQQVSGLPYRLAMNPSAPRDVAVDRSTTSPSDSAALRWTKGEGKVDQYNVTWSQYDPSEEQVYPDTVVQDVVPSDGLVTGEFDYALSPLAPGNTYRVMTQAISADIPGQPVESIFTFAPSAPTGVSLTGVTPYSVGMNVSLFGDTWDNVTLQAEIVDADNMSYPTENIWWSADGRHGIFTLVLNRTRLQPDQNYSVKVWTIHDNVWSYPFSKQVTLDPLTPAILSVREDPAAPDTSITIVWVPGQHHSNQFLFELQSADGSERKTETLYTELPDPDTPQQFTFTGLTPGQSYTITLTSITANALATALDYSIQMPPSSPSDVTIRRNDQSPTDSARAHWILRQGDQDGFVLTLSQYGAERNVLLATEIYPVPEPVMEGLLFDHVLSPLMPGQTYNLTLETLSGGRTGYPVSKMFTFASTAPSTVVVDRVSPYGVDVSVTVFGDSLKDVPVRANVTNSQNVSYPVSDVRLVRNEGNAGVVRVSYHNDTHMVPGQNYTLSIQTRVDNNTWSYPITSLVSLDPLTPAIVDVKLDDTAPHEALHVSWVPGTSQAEEFTVTLIARDQPERRDIPVMAGTGNVDTPLNYTFRDLRAGQHYRVLVTASGNNRTASSLIWDVLTHNVPPTNVRITPPEGALLDSVVLQWDYLTDKDSNFVISWAELGSAEVTTSDFQIQQSLTPNIERHSFTISPLTMGRTYWVHIQAKVEDTLGDPVEKIFTLAPTAPSDVQILGLTPNGALLNVSLFDGAWENVTMLARISDVDDNDYPTQTAVVEEPRGRHALVRISPSGDRLPAGQEYIISLQTIFNNTWSFPITTSSPLDSLSPAITQLRRDPLSPETGFTVEWLPGRNGSQSFSLELVSADGSEYINDTITEDVKDVNKELSYTFSDLTPGQRYTFRLTAVGVNQSASALNRTIQMLPAQAYGVKIDRSEISADDSATLLWEYGDNLHDSFRITWSPLDQSSEPVTKDVLPNTTRDRSVTAYHHQLYPLITGQTYHVMLETLADGQPSQPVEKIFTFAPTSPTNLYLRGVTPFLVGMNVSLFGEAWENLTLQAQVNDSLGNTYLPDNVTVVRTEGRHGLTRISLKNDRLPSGRNYTVSLQTRYNDTWTYPITSTISLDPLTPAIVDVERVEESPSTAFTVTWVAGSNNTDVFLLRVYAADGSEERESQVYPSFPQSTESLLNYTFSDLTPGQKYVVLLTAVMGDKNASALNATVQLFPPTPGEVKVEKSRDRADELAFSWTALGVIDHFVVEGQSLSDSRLRFEQVVRGLEPVNGAFKYTVGSLVRGDTYQVRVKAVDGPLSSASPYLNVSLYPGKPYDLELKKYDRSPDDSLLLTWMPRGGKVDYFDIEVMLSKGRGFLYSLQEVPQATEPYNITLEALVKGERYEVTVTAVVGDLSSGTARTASTVGPSVTIVGITPTSLDVELDLFGNVYDDLNATLTVTDQEGQEYTASGQKNLTEYSDQGGQLIRLDFPQRLPFNNSYSVYAQLDSQGTPVLDLESEDTLLDPLTPYILSMHRHLATPNTTLAVYWLPGSEGADKFTVRWSQVNSPDVEERDVKGSAFMVMNANLTDLSPGDMYAVWVIATGTDNRQIASVPEYKRMAPAVPVDVTAVRSEVDPQVTVSWTQGNGSIQCFNTTIWPRPRVAFVADHICLPAKGPGELHQISYAGLLPGETYWTGINSEQSGLQSEKLWVPVTMYPPEMKLVNVKEDPELGVVVMWAPVEEGKVDNVEVSWVSLSGSHNGSRLYRPSQQITTLEGLSPGTSYIIGVNSQVQNTDGDLVTTSGDTQLFVTEPVAPKSAVFMTTQDGVMVNVKPGEGLADSYLFQWTSDQQRSGEARLSAEQAEGKNSSFSLPPGARYVFSVQSVSGGKESPAMIETVITDPEPPRNLALDRGLEPSSSVNLRWDAPNSYIQGYRISWEPASADNTSELTVNSRRATSATIRNLQPGTTYSVSVQSVAWNQTSDSVRDTIHLAPSVPRVVYAEPTANSNIEVGWVFGEGEADTAFIYVDDGFTSKQTVVPVTKPSGSGQRVYHHVVTNLKEELRYNVSVATGSQGVQGAKSISLPVTIPLASMVPKANVNVTSRSAALTWSMSTDNLPPSPIPLKDKYRIRVISPDVTDDFACVKEIIVGFCRHCPMRNMGSGNDHQAVPADNSASPCLETVHEELPVSETVTYNVTGLKPFSSYKLILYPEGGSSSPATVITADTSIEAPESISPPVVRMLDGDHMEVCVLPPEPYPGPVTYRVEVFDHQPGSTGESLLNETLSDAESVSGNLTQCFTTTSQSFWTYRFIVVATTEMGSLQSNDTIFQTPESAPGAVRNFRVQAIPYNYSAVRLVWDYPEQEQLGANITAFIIRYWRQEPKAGENGTNNANRSNSSGYYEETIIRELSGITYVDGHLMTDIPIKPEYNYSIQVGALTATGLVGNVTQNVTFASEIGPPPLLQKDYPPVITLVTDQENSNGMTVSVNPTFFMDNSHGEILDYGLVVKNSEVTSGPVETRNSLEYYSNYKNWNDANKGQTAAYRATPKGWNLDSTMSQVVFTIGQDGLCTGLRTEFCNGELDPSKQYSIKGFTCTAAGCTETRFYDGFTVGPRAGACSVSADRILSQYTDLELALIIVVAILIFLLIIMVVLVLILHLRKQKQKEGRLVKGELNDGHDTMVRGQHMGLTKM